MQDNSQENNNFETIISTWRRLSGEPVESSAFLSMSGDSSNQLHKKKEEENSLLVVERPKGPIATAASGATVVVAEYSQDKEKEADPAKAEDKIEKSEKPEFIKYDCDEHKEAAGDYRNEKDDDDYLENDSKPIKKPDGKSDKESSDKVDSVYLRPPPAHKVRSNASTNNDEEDCGLKCLYYTLQCCDCILM